MTVQITGINLSTGAPYSATAYGDGVGDDKATLQAALNACGLIVLPAGTFRITGTITAPQNNGAGIVGAGVNSTTIKADFTNGTAIKSSDDWAPTFRDFKITRVGTPTPGSYGLDMGAGTQAGLDTQDGCVLQNLTIIGHYIGLRAMWTGKAILQNVAVSGSVSHGIDLNGQWDLDQVSSNDNGGCGFYHHSNDAAGNGNSSGQYNGLTAARNGSHGYYAVGIVFAIRMSNSSFTENGGCGLYIDNYNPNQVNIFSGVSVSGNDNIIGWYLGSQSGFNALYNCSVSGSPTYGLYSQTSDQTSVRGGSFNSNGSYGILFVDGRGTISNITASGNLNGVGASSGVEKLTVDYSALSGSTNPTDVSAIGANYVGYSNT